jgi:threonine dehydratase
MIVCGCGILMERYPALNYQTGQTMPWTTHQQVLARAAGFVSWVDDLLVADIERLWEAGIETFSSCQDNYGKFISIRDKSQADAARNLVPWVTAVEESGAPGAAAVLCERVRGERQQREPALANGSA